MEQMLIPLILGFQGVLFWHVPEAPSANVCPQTHLTKDQLLWLILPSVQSPGLTKGRVVTQMPGLQHGPGTVENVPRLPRLAG